MDVRLNTIHYTTRCVRVTTTRIFNMERSLWWMLLLVIVIVVITCICVTTAIPIQRRTCEVYAGAYGNSLSAYYFHYYMCKVRGCEFSWKWNVRSKYTGMELLLPPNSDSEYMYDVQDTPKRKSLGLLSAEFGTWPIKWEMDSQFMRYTAPALQHHCKSITTNSKRGEVYDIVIHYRLGDVPFVRSKSRTYCLKRYEYYTNAIRRACEFLELSSPARKLSCLIMCTLKRGKGSVEWSQKYLDDFCDFVEQSNIGILDVKQRTNGTLHEDFVTMLNAPVLICSGGSLSLFAGTGAQTQNLCIYPIPSDRSEISFSHRENMESFSAKDFEILHSDVKEYKSTDVFKMLRETIH